MSTHHLLITWKVEAEDRRHRLVGSSTVLFGLYHEWWRYILLYDNPCHVDSVKGIVPKKKKRVDS
jgi:hypothetical protein